MVKFDLNKEYSLKLGEAEPVNSIYLGIKRYKGNIYKHFFIVYDLCNRTYFNYRFYFGGLDNTILKEKVVHIKNPVYKKIKSVEERILSPLIEKLRNQ